MMRTSHDPAEYRSWNGVPDSRPSAVVRLDWEHIDPRTWGATDRGVLPFGAGRSYGDSCLNDGGVLLDTSGLRGLQWVDEARGVLRCAAGETMRSVLGFALPRGWFLPVTPGTSQVTMGGATAHDVHGKNHHRAGTWGCHIRSLQLLRSTNKVVLCSPDIEPALFAATIGGLGLTGVILSIDLQLKRVEGPWMETRTTPFASLNEYFAVTDELDESHEYTVAWLDCLSAGRGILFAGNHSEQHDVAYESAGRRVTVPPQLRMNLCRRVTVRTFNQMYLLAHRLQDGARRASYDTFFYPLDAVAHWYRLYGSAGFLQYQFVVPRSGAADVIGRILASIAARRAVPALSVLKTFGRRRSPGLLSFPRPGVTLAIDFPNSRTTRDLLTELDGRVAEAGGRVYPAKDARMSRDAFQAFYPEWGEFEGSIDPAFSSDFFRRVGPRVR